MTFYAGRRHQFLNRDADFLNLDGSSSKGSTPNRPHMESTSSESTIVDDAGWNAYGLHTPVMTNVPCVCQWMYDLIGISHQQSAGTALALPANALNGRASAQACAIWARDLEFELDGHIELSGRTGTSACRSRRLRLQNVTSTSRHGRRFSRTARLVRGNPHRRMSAADTDHPEITNRPYPGRWRWCRQKPSERKASRIERRTRNLGRLVYDKRQLRGWNHDMPGVLGSRREDCEGRPREVRRGIHIEIRLRGRRCRPKFLELTPVERQTPVVPYCRRADVPDLPTWNDRSRSAPSATATARRSSPKRPPLPWQAIPRYRRRLPVRMACATAAERVNML